MQDLRRTLVFFRVIEYNSFCAIINANLAQLVEQRIRNAQVAGSNPAVGSKQNPASLKLAGFCYLTGNRAFAKTENKAGDEKCKHEIKTAEKRIADR